MNQFISRLTRPTLATLLILLGGGLAAPRVEAQALLPYTLPLDEERLTATGLSLAQEAAQLAQFQQYDEALARIQLAAQLAPQDPQILTLMGSLYLQVGDSSTAVTTLEKAKVLKADDPVIWFTLGSAYFSEAKYLQAANALEKGLSFEPSNPGAHFDLGNAYYKLNRYPKAIEHYEAAVRYDEMFWPAINNIGLVFYEMGQAESAIEQWERSLDVAQEEPEPTLAIAVANYAANMNRPAAIESATAALERDSRYANLEFLEENLWGNRLLGATEALFDTPGLQDVLSGL
ncbi:tetratricopeptide repeat protein [Leptothoe kymatousa]|uniref:Tetratricopeptide repeat protein n=1 Tax=Leptothoe kymatousa TAU-MAC 1615 TaxID=2364775 RepID=A0ABS5Y298_9CYAN|nr:tetratricopeptide repeat protein [Leptothoe kymatousa]MBT9311959.1 tetratricopeptide repeat protein [Leptothoe kymatousa TAU-MAC 1615]